MVGGGLIGAVGNEGALAGPQRAHQRHQVVERVAFEVELGLRPLFQQLGEVVHVARADVALVGPRVHGDAVGTGFEHEGRGAGHAGHGERARVAQQGDPVQVDRQPGGAALRVQAGREQGVHGLAVFPKFANFWRSSMTWRVRSGAEPR